MTPTIRSKGAATSRREHGLRFPTCCICHRRSDHSWRDGAGRFWHYCCGHFNHEGIPGAGLFIYDMLPGGRCRKGKAA